MGWRGAPAVLRSGCSTCERWPTVTFLGLSGCWWKERTGGSCDWVPSYSQLLSLHMSFMLTVFATNSTWLNRVCVWGGLVTEEGWTFLSPDAKVLQSYSLPVLLWSKHLLDGNQEASCPDACAINKLCDICVCVRVCVCSCTWFILDTKVLILQGKWGQFWKARTFCLVLTISSTCLRVMTRFYSCG